MRRGIEWPGATDLYPVPGREEELALLLADLRAALIEVLALAVASDEWDRGHLRALVQRIEEVER